MNLADQENLADFRIPKNTAEYLRSVGCSSFEGTCSSVCVCARARVRVAPVWSIGLSRPYHGSRRQRQLCTLAALGLENP